MNKEHFRLEFEAHISPIYTPIAIACIDNGCCKDQPVIITANKRSDGSINYSAQCACGMWCTTGVNTASEALQRYERMTAGENLYQGKLYGREPRSYRAIKPLREKYSPY